MFRFKILNLLVLCAISTYVAGAGSNIPYDLLMKSVDDLRSKRKNIIYDGNFEDEIFNGKVDERWILSLTSNIEIGLHTVDKIVTELFVEDRYFQTKNGIRIGDTLEKVKKLNPDLTFRGPPSGPDGGVYDLVSIDKKIEYWFDSGEIRKQMREGKKFSTNDREVKNLKLWVINIKK